MKVLQKTFIVILAFAVLISLIAFAGYLSEIVPLKISFPVFMVICLSIFYYCSKH